MTRRHIIKENKEYHARRRNCRRRSESPLRPLAFEPLEDRRMLFNTFGPGVVWPTTDLTFSYSNLLDGMWASGLANNSEQIQAAEEAMGIWASVTPLTFSQIGDAGPSPGTLTGGWPHPTTDDYDATDRPIIRWGHHGIDGNTGTNTLAHAGQPGTGGLNGDIHFDNGNTFAVDTFLETAVHEIGHTLGLAHANGNISGGVCPPPLPAIMDACTGSFDYTGLGDAFLIQDDINGINSLYDFGLGYVLNSTGRLSVYGTDQGDVFNVNYDSGTNSVTVSNGIRSFTRTLAGVTQVTIVAGRGDDLITVNGLPSQITAAVDGGAGADRLTVRGGAGGDTLRLLNGSTAQNNNSGILFRNTEAVVLSGQGGGDVMEVSSAPANLSVTINGGDMDDQIFIANGGSPNAVQAAIVVNGEAGADTLNLAPNAPSTISAITGAITFNGGTEADTLNVGSGNLGAVTGLVTYHGGGEGDKLFLYDGANASLVNYTIGDASVTRDDPPPFGGLSYSYSGVSEITLDANQAPNNINVLAANLLKITVNGNGGDDNLAIGNGNNLAAGLGEFVGNGGAGLDTLTLNDSLSAHNGNWVVLGAFTSDPETVYLGLHAYDTEGYERVSVFAGKGNNPVQFQGTLTQDVTVNGGGGNDDFTFTRTSSFRDFFEGEENPPFHYQVTVDGGGDFNTLTVDDASLATDRSYSITQSNVYATEGAPLGLDFDYDNFQSATFRAGPAPLFGSNEFHIFGTPADIPPGQQMRIFGGAVADHLVIYPSDAVGNLTVNCDVTFQGNGGVDTILVDDSASPLGINYQMAGGTLTGMGAGSVFVSGNEQLTFNAGSGHDIWTTVLGPLSNPPTTINAGGGSNTFNLDASLTPIAWTINGGPNLDTLNLFDSNNPSPSTSWNINATSITRTRSDGGTAPKVYTHSALDRITVNGGGSVDLFFVDAVALGHTLTLNAGANLDGMLLGSQATNNLDSIQGAVVFNGQTDGGNISVLDAADPTGDTVHLTQTSLGAYPGDNLFGSSGSLTFSDLVNFGVFPGITLNLGMGADMIYAQPLATARHTINAGNPTTPPGDKLSLQLEWAGAVNPVVSNPSAPSGNVTSSNLQTLNWTGVDQPVTVLIPGDFNQDGAVGASDLTVWRGSAGVSAAGDGDGDGDTDGADFLVWQRRLGQQTNVPAAVAATSSSGVAKAAAFDSLVSEAEQSTPNDPHELSSLLVLATPNSSLATRTNRAVFRPASRAGEIAFARASGPAVPTTRRVEIAQLFAALETPSHVDIGVLDGVDDAFAALERALAM